MEGQESQFTTDILTLFLMVTSRVFSERVLPDMLQQTDLARCQAQSKERVKICTYIRSVCQ